MPKNSNSKIDRISYGDSIINLPFSIDISQQSFADMSSILSACLYIIKELVDNWPMEAKNGASR